MVLTSLEVHVYLDVNKRSLLRDYTTFLHGRPRKSAVEFRSSEPRMHVTAFDPLYWGSPYEHLALHSLVTLDSHAPSNTMPQRRT
jgi:hypothetical protein